MGNKDNNLQLISGIFEAIRKETKLTGYINCFDRFDLLLYIHSHSLHDCKPVLFSDLSRYIKQSDVYLASTLKEGIETGYLESSTCPDDKRKKGYTLSKTAALEIENLLNTKI